MHGFPLRRLFRATLNITKYYTETDAEEKINYFETTPELADITAVRKDNYIIISGISLRPGLQTLDALEDIVKAIHPEGLR